MPSNASDGQPTARRSRVDLTDASERGPVWRQYLRALGPGLVTGASDDDPSAILTYASAGARAGYGLLWTCLASFPLMIAVQVNADRTALATGQNIGSLARQHFGRWGRRVFAALLFGHLLANGLVIAADLLAVGSALDLLHAGPAWLWAPLAGVLVTVLVASGSFAVLARILKVLCLALLAYVVVVFAIDVDWGAALHDTLVPHVDLTSTSLALVLAVLGATLPPYVFLWQSTHRLEEMRDEPEGGDRPLPLRRRPPAEAARKRRMSFVDVVCGMAFAVAVMFCVMVATAGTIWAKHPRDITSAADAASALEPVAGGAAKAIFAIGILAAGTLAIPVLAGAGSSAFAGYLRKPWGFSRSIAEAPAFYALVALGTVGGTVLSSLGVDPIRLLVLAATVNGISAAPLLAVVMVISGDRKLMGEHRPGPLPRIVGWAGVALMGSIALASLALVL